MKVFNVLKNEMIRFLNEKKLYILLAVVMGLVILGTVAYKDMINNVVSSNIKSNSYSDEVKVLLQSFSGISFSKMCLVDFIYKPYFSIYLIFIAIIAANVFSNDYNSGNLKFTLLTNTSPAQVYIGKILFMAVVSLMIVSINLVLSLLVGQIAFGGEIIIKELLNVVGLYLMATIPGVAFSLIIGIVSLTKLKPNIIVGSSIGFIITLGIIDSLTNFKYVSPVGVLSFFENNIPTISSGILISCGISIIYILLLSLGIVKACRRIDYSI
ncbi:MAG: hypothetical protein ACRDA5_10485 [Clostridium sp.]